MSDEFENDDLNLEGQEAAQDYQEDNYAPEENYPDESQSYDDAPSNEDMSSDDNGGDYDDGGDYYDEGDGGDENNKADGKKSKKSKQQEDDAPKMPAKMRREWENEITTNKKVKREELRRKVKKAMLFMLVFALVVTSIVYIMLLFIQENNVRITASSQNNDNSISLSFDNNYWTPYLNAQGPTEVWDISYSPIYGREMIDTIDEVYSMLRADSVEVGTKNGTNFIRFTFMLRNNGNADVNVDYEITLENDATSGLQNALRVMWGESFKNPDYAQDDPDNPDDPTDPTRTRVSVYAALSNNPRLANTSLNALRGPEDGYLEYVAYPMGSDLPDYNWDTDFYDKLEDGSLNRDDALRNGFLEPTLPFESGNTVFKKEAVRLARGDIMYCYCCIWLEGSDFDCVDSALEGFVKLGINFVAY